MHQLLIPLSVLMPTIVQFVQAAFGSLESMEESAGRLCIFALLLATAFGRGMRGKHKGHSHAHPR